MKKEAVSKGQPLFIFCNFYVIENFNLNLKTKYVK